MTSSWDNVILDPIYSYGFTCGPGFGTRIIQTDGGGEERVSVISEPIWSWTATRENVGDLSDVVGLRDFFLARRGALYGFLFFDPIDFSTGAGGNTAITGDDETLGYGDGSTTEFTMRKTYADPGGMTSRSYARRIIPISQAITAAMATLIPGAASGDRIDPIVKVDGTLQVEGTDYSISSSGQVRFAVAPVAAAAITAGAYFTVPARFTGDTDEMFEMTADSFGGDVAAFSIVSLPYDEEVPVIPGATEYGFVEFSSALKTVDSKESHWYSYTGATDASVILPSVGYYPMGGPHFRIINDSSDNTRVVTIKDNEGVTMQSLAINEVSIIYVRSDGLVPEGREAVAMKYTKT